MAVPGSSVSLGLTPGESLTTFSFEGDPDSVLVNVAVPEVALTGLAIIRRRARRAPVV